MSDGEGLVTSYEYDSANRLVKVSNEEIGVTQYSYDALGRGNCSADGEGTGLVRYKILPYDAPLR